MDRFLDNTTRSPYPEPTTAAVIPTTTTTSIPSPLFGAGKYGGGADGSSNVAPSVSTCSPSSRDPCNGGQCVLVNGAVYTCRCRDGFTGAYCENS